MSKKKPLSRVVVLGLAASTLLTVGIIYSLGPILPSTARQWLSSVTWRVNAQTSYLRGWYDASSAARSGKLSYSFHQFSIEGLTDYAENDGIEPCFPPKGESHALQYLVGFNRRMETALRKKFDSDFPENYVRKYSRDGWLDYRRQQPTRCPIHQKDMTEMIIPLEFMTPNSLPHLPFDWETAGAAQFPFPGSTKKVDFSWFQRPKKARVNACPDCTEAEKQWWVSTARNNSRASVP
jgi:hypothetical protein